MISNYANLQELGKKQDSMSKFKLIASIKTPFFVLFLSSNGTIATRPRNRRCCCVIQLEERFSSILPRHCLLSNFSGRRTSRRRKLHAFIHLFRHTRPNFHMLARGFTFGYRRGGFVHVRVEYENHVCVIPRVLVTTFVRSYCYRARPHRVA